MTDVTKTKLNLTSKICHKNGMQGEYYYYHLKHTNRRRNLKESLSPQTQQLHHLSCFTEYDPISQSHRAKLFYADLPLQL